MRKNESVKLVFEVKFRIAGNDREKLTLRPPLPFMPNLQHDQDSKEDSQKRASKIRELVV